MGIAVKRNSSSGVILSTESLVLQKVSRHNSGRYTCQAVNDRGETSSHPVTLRVQCNNILNSTTYGYKLNKDPNSRVTHAFYLDDLKLYAHSSDQLQSMMEIVVNFSSSICMSLGLNKCNILNVKQGKIIESPSMHLLSENINIDALSTDDYYRYLGMKQQLHISDTSLKKSYADSFYTRLNKVMKTELNSKNKIKAINTWAIPLLTYTFGILKWSNTDLETMNIKIRTIFTSFRIHHCHSALERIYLPISEGGRGLLNLTALHDKQIINLRSFFQTKVHCS
ncbi:hypothetical protein M8J77_018995 [Diaphorina citri]|nr:hypothetical protein M8J77_018995 [Diaphorina citri]